MEDKRKLTCTSARRGKLLLVEPLPFYEDKKLADDTIPFLAFEWIGKRNYLCEHNWGTRGANCTSADFAFRFRRNDGQIQLVLGEWKYTEVYGKSPRKDSKTLSTKMGIYRIAFDRELLKRCRPGSARRSATLEGISIESIWLVALKGDENDSS